MAEPVMLSWLDSAPVQLESATLKPHGTITFRTLAILFQALRLNAKQKIDLISTIVYNNQELVNYQVLKQCLAKHSPGGASAWHERYMHAKEEDSPYCFPRNILAEQQLADFLLNLPFPEKSRSAFVDELLPGLERRLRDHVVRQNPRSLNAQQRWQLLQTIVPADTLHSPVTAYFFSTPADAHYHRYVTDREQQSEASQPLAERPQVVALRAYLRDCGRLFQQGVLAPPACNIFHNIYSDSVESYRFLYTQRHCTRPGRICHFDGESSNHPNIGPVPMTLRDGGDGRFMTSVGWRQSMQSHLTWLQQKRHLPGTVEDKETVVESLASACLGTVLLLGRILRAGTEHHPRGWFNSGDRDKESELADLLGAMVVDLFSHSCAVERTALHSRLCEQDGGQLVRRSAREMQGWMSDDFIDHILAKKVPGWLYPDYTGKRENVLIPDSASTDICYDLDHGRPENQSHDLGLPYATTPLQGFEILIKKALAEAVLLASERTGTACQPPEHGNFKKDRRGAGLTPE